MDYKTLQKEILINSYKAGACHIGSALSCVKILNDLFKTFRKGDVFIFSKASGVATLYCLLADQGKFPKSKVAEYLKKYPEVSKEVRGVLWSGGSLGLGLPIAVGLALADRNRRVYCLMSDGECQEGTTWEASLFARQHKLKNLYVIVDNNSYQALGKTKDILDLTTAFEFMKKTLPNCRIVNTVKGDKFKLLQGTKGHYYNLKKEDLDKLLCQI